MQFIFGDDTSKYTLLYQDDPSGNAAKIMDMIRVPYSPNPRFDSIGFWPFGTNNTRALFFYFCKDMKMVRNVYYLHGVYDEAKPELFYEGEYEKRIFSDFIDQDGFDALRQNAASVQPGSIDAGIKTELMATPLDQIEIQPTALYQILKGLYQRTGVTVVMDDEAYSTDRVRLLIKKIFYYLTPSLRKTCSYISAVDDTGGQEFMLRFMPRSLMRKDASGALVELDAPAQISDRSRFYEIVQGIVAMSENEREACFANFEALTYGKEAIYKKQVFERFYFCYTAVMKGDLTSPETVDESDALLGDYLMDSKCPATPMAYPFLSSVLKTKYESVEALNEMVNWDSLALARFEDFIEQHLEVVRKVYYLADPELKYFESGVRARFVEQPWPVQKMGEIEGIVNAYKTLYEHYSSGAGYAEIRMAGIFRECCVHLGEVQKAYRAAYNQCSAAVHEILQRHNGALVSDVNQVIVSAFAASVETLEHARNLVDGFSEHVAELMKTQLIEPYNAQVRERMQAEEAKRREENLQAVLDQYLKCLKDWQRTADREVQPTEFRTKPQRGRGGAGAMASDPMADMDGYVSRPSVGVLLPDEQELRALSADARYRDRLAIGVADYIKNAVRYGTASYFIQLDPNITKISHEEATVFRVADELAAKDSVVAAILYLARYCDAIEVAVERMINLPASFTLIPAELNELKQYLPAVMERKAAYIQDDETRQRIIAILKEEPFEENTKARKALCSIIASVPGIGKSGKRKGGSGQGGSGMDRSSVVLFAGIAVLVVALIAIGLLIAKMMGAGDKNEAVTTDPVVTVVTTGGETEDPNGNAGGSTTTAQETDQPGA